MVEIDSTMQCPTQGRPLVIPIVLATIKVAKQLCRPNLQRLGDLQDDGEGGDAVATFDEADVGAGDAGALRDWSCVRPRSSRQRRTTSPNWTASARFVFFAATLAS